MTVHPLGGCAMGNDCYDGVVDDLGQVFDPDPKSGTSIHQGLVVLDGSIIPTALGTNPALSIAALSLRAIASLKQTWGFDEDGESDSANLAFRERPRFSAPVVDELTDEKQPLKESPATELQFIERLSGPVTLTLGNAKPAPYIAEITLQFNGLSVDELVGSTNCTDAPKLEVDDESAQGQAVSKLRIYDPLEWQNIQRRNLSAKGLEQALDQAALVSTPVTGTLTLFRREPTHPFIRTAVGFCAWLRNRGLRDIWQSLKDSALPSVSTLLVLFSNPWAWLRQKASNGWQWLLDALALSSRAGEVRLFEYDLRTGPNEPGGKAPQTVRRLFADAAIKGKKRLTYRRRANPWRQLKEAYLQQFPGLCDTPDQAVLALEPKFLSRVGVPLLQVHKQANGVSELADLAALAGYLTRMLLTIHLWSFRKPDTPLKRTINRLPDRLPGLPAPEIHTLDLGVIPDDKVPGFSQGGPVCCRLTRYPNKQSERPPVLMIHGYSASGTTFAHPAVNPNLAGHLWRSGRDIWVLDLRSSCGMPTATYPWHFDDMAREDIPTALDFVHRQTGKKIDVVAHCMGAAKFSMAVLDAENYPGESACGRVPDWINKAVLSQIGPVLEMSPDNTFRAYMLSYLKTLLPDDYRFQRSAKPSLLEDLLDRALATVPYTDEQFDAENPRRFWQRRPYVGTRHRMDALYGETFLLENMAPEVLASIDDLFGPLNVDTVTQVIHFARLKTITDRTGRNRHVDPGKLRRQWRFPTLSVHGERNGLADVKTLYRMEAVMAEAGIDLETEVFENFGHQDSLIGCRAEEVFARIERFLDQVPADSKSNTAVSETEATLPLLAKLPWAGPVIGRAATANDTLTIPLRLGASPTLGQPLRLVLVPVLRQQDRFVIAAPSGQENQYLTVVDPETDHDGWIKTQLMVAQPSSTAIGWLTFLIYDQLPGLEVPSFGPLTVKNFRDYVLADEPQGDSRVAGVAVEQPLAGDALDDALLAAVQTALQKNSARLEAGLIELDAVRSPVFQGLCFALGSCQYPAGMIDSRPAFDSYQRLEQRIVSPSGLGRPDCLLLMGDQVYLDPTAGLLDPTEKDERYVKPYYRWLTQRYVRSVLRRVPAYMMLDDHEIHNDWALPVEGPPGEDYHQGTAAYSKFQRGTDQPLLTPTDGQDMTARPALWFSFSENGFDFFMLDTRSERSPRNASNLASVEIIHEEQLQDLLEWLEQRKDNDAPKFIVSPSMLLPRRLRSQMKLGGLHSDAWDGYPASLQRVLACIAKHHIQRVVFLSGDEHLSCIARATLTEATTGRATVIHSVHSSGFYSPLPFVNSQAADFAADENFSFTLDGADGKEGKEGKEGKDADDETYHCEVRTRFAEPGDGFALMRVSKEQDEWAIHCEFDRASSSKAEPILLD